MSNFKNTVYSIFLRENGEAKPTKPMNWDDMEPPAGWQSKAMADKNQIGIDPTDPGANTISRNNIQNLANRLLVAGYKKDKIGPAEAEIAKEVLLEPATHDKLKDGTPTTPTEKWFRNYYTPGAAFFPIPEEHWLDELLQAGVAPTSDNIELIKRRMYFKKRTLDFNRERDRLAAEHEKNMKKIDQDRLAAEHEKNMKKIDDEQKTEKIRNTSYKDPLTGIERALTPGEASQKAKEQGVSSPYHDNPSGYGVMTADEQARLNQVIQNPGDAQSRNAYRVKEQIEKGQQGLLYNKTTGQYDSGAGVPIRRDRYGKPIVSDPNASPFLTRDQIGTPPPVDEWEYDDEGNPIPDTFLSGRSRRNSDGTWDGMSKAASDNTQNPAWKKMWNSSQDADSRKRMEASQRRKDRDDRLMFDARMSGDPIKNRIEGGGLDDIGPRTDDSLEGRREHIRKIRKQELLKRDIRQQEKYQNESVSHIAAATPAATLVMTATTTPAPTPAPTANVSVPIAAAELSSAETEQGAAIAQKKGPLPAVQRYARELTLANQNKNKEDRQGGLQGRQIQLAHYQNNKALTFFAEQLKRKYIEEEVVNPENQPMSKSETIHRDKIRHLKPAKNARVVKGPRGRLDTPEEAKFRLATYITLRSRKGKKKENK